jgi:hypothetical protein
MALTRLKAVAGVTIPDTALCNAAIDLLQATRSRPHRKSYWPPHLMSKYTLKEVL